MEDFLTDPAIKRLKQHTATLFHRCFPHHARDYYKVASHSKFENIKPCGNFLWGIQSSVAINKEGNYTVCKPHCDTSDLVTSLCAVTPFGDFDPTVQNSGSLLLHDAFACIQLRAGDICFFPSALVAHSNDPMVKGHSQGLIASFTLTSLFQFVHLGFKTLSASTAKEKTAWYNACEDCWKYFCDINTKGDLEWDFLYQYEDDQIDERNYSNKDNDVDSDNNKVVSENEEDMN
ncbi:hypothetical protein CBS101457_000179 [Exobasidium rhododendri]|nr:hypothetical protein CBS101457_000179 [Exobasidium rhododendri]